MFNDEKTKGMAAATASPIVNRLPELEVATPNSDPMTRAAAATAMYRNSPPAWDAA